MKRKDKWIRISETILADIQDAMDPPRRRTEPRPLWHVLAMQKGYEKWMANKKKQARIKSEARLKAQHKARTPVDGTGWRYQVLGLMAPGEWYGMKALGRAIGADPSKAGRMRQVLERNAWVRRAANPAWSTKAVDPWEIMAGAVREPKWLYQITEAGIEWRASPPKAKGRRRA